MLKFLTYSLLIFTLISCASQTITEESNFELKSSDLSAILKSFNSISKQVDNIYKKDTSKLELYVQLEEKDLIKRVPNYDETPDTCFASYNVIRNDTGQIIYISEYPTSRSGDWFLIYENYFDNNGNLIAFVRKCSFFNSGCAEIVLEKSEYYYNQKHELVKKTYEITDGDKHPLNYKNCVFYYRYKYKIYNTLTKYLKNNKFEN